MSITESTRELRHRLRDNEREAGRLRVLDGVASALAEESAAKTGLMRALVQVLRFLSADSGLVLCCEQGALTVNASVGQVLPVGASILAGGILATALQSPHQPILREHIESRLRLGQSPVVAIELLIPLRLQGTVVGILAILNEQSAVALSQDDLRTMQTLATLIAGAVQRPALVPKSKSTRRAGAAVMALLTPREQQVLVLLPRGLSNSEIAAQLGMATGTAKIHVERILHKLGVTDRTQAAVRAVEWGYKP